LVHGSEETESAGKGKPIAILDTDHCVLAVSTIGELANLDDSDAKSVVVTDEERGGTFVYDQAAGLMLFSTPENVLFRLCQNVLKYI
jgi:hypothetical protein